MNKTTHNFWHK